MRSVQRPRDRYEEAIQQKRYALLERIYLLTGSDCERRVTTAEIAAQLGDSVEPNSSVTRDLIQLGYLDQDATGEICITPLAVEYLQKDAWRRRTIRE